MASNQYTGRSCGNFVEGDLLDGPSDGQGDETFDVPCVEPLPSMPEVVLLPHAALGSNGVRGDLVEHGRIISRCFLLPAEGTVVPGRSFRRPICPTIVRQHA
jgi:hypothetical protein